MSKKKNPHIGSSFESWLDETGIRAEVTAAAIKAVIARKLRFLSFARFHYISAKQSQGIGPMLASVAEAYRAALSKLSTPRLTRVLQSAVTRQTPP